MEKLREQAGVSTTPLLYRTCLFEPEDAAVYLHLGPGLVRWPLLSS
jgi:hypothetical protein